MRKLIAGNWKMNGLRQSLAEIGEVAARASRIPERADTLLCLPATLLMAAADAFGDVLRFGAQDCHTAVSGAHTGDLSPEMLGDAGATHVIVGHSERRADHTETDDLVRRKAVAVHRAGLIPIVCVGETLAQRDAGQAGDIVAAQLRKSLPDTGALVVAYEPVWAIGTGRTPLPSDILDMHTHIRRLLTDRFGSPKAVRTQILYGGSLKPENAEAILGLTNVDGGLIGGASLKASDFLAICAAVS